jgi:hypothetical protein
MIRAEVKKETFGKTKGRGKIGTSYIPPVKQIFYAYNLSRLWMPLIFGNTSPGVLCTFLRRILLLEDEPAPDRYGYPASPVNGNENCTIFGN